MSDLETAFKSGILGEVRELWFSGLEGQEEKFVLPGRKDMGRWFSQDDKFDKACVYVSTPSPLNLLLVSLSLKFATLGLTRP